MCAWNGTPLWNPFQLPCHRFTALCCFIRTSKSMYQTNCVSLFSGRAPPRFTIQGPSFSPPPPDSRLQTSPKLLAQECSPCRDRGWSSSMPLIGSRSRNAPPLVTTIVEYRRSQQPNLSVLGAGKHLVSVKGQIMRWCIVFSGKMANTCYILIVADDRWLRRHST